MAEVLAEFAEPLFSSDRSYRAQACGAPMADGRWEGWVEFLPLDGGTPLRTPRETTQPNRTDAEYWASGLSSVYLEGALDRALRRPSLRSTPKPAPLFERPAADFVTMKEPQVHVHAVLDPFSVYEKGESLLRQELQALSAWHLVNIIVAYKLSSEPAVVLSRLPASTLSHMIVVGVRGQMSPR